MTRDKKGWREPSTLKKTKEPPRAPGRRNRLRSDQRAPREADRFIREREQQSVLELADVYETTLAGWARALDLRDHETEGHSQRVTDLTVRLARAMGIADAALVHIRRGALLHDIGKMGIPDSVLLKPAPLTEQEWTMMRRHPTYALQLLEPISYLQPALEIPYSHHEKWDGSGYPCGMKGDTIPLAARIFAVADIWDAIRSNRPYRPAWPEDKALAHIVSLAGSHLDPRVVEVFIDVIRTVSNDAPGISTSPSARPRTRILVVDDYECNLTLFDRWLASDGYEVLTARSAHEALKLVAQSPPQLVLLDVELPDINGLAVMQRLKGSLVTSQIPVILLTGLPVRPEHRTEAADYLIKPIDAYELRARVRRALDRGPSS